MKQEILDLVDEEDRIIGTVTREQADVDPSLIHREVGVILLDGANRVMFQRRSIKKKVLPGYWSTGVAGHIDAGEAPMSAMLREMEEEIGFSLELQFYSKELTRLPNEAHFKYWYTAKYSGQSFTLNKEEVDEVKFLSQPEIIEMQNHGAKFYQSFVEVVKKYWSQNSKLEKI